MEHPKTEYVTDELLRDTHKALCDIQDTMYATLNRLNAICGTETADDVRATMQRAYDLRQRVFAAWQRTEQTASAVQPFARGSSLPWSAWRVGRSAPHDQLILTLGDSAGHPCAMVAKRVFENHQSGEWFDADGKWMPGWTPRIWREMEAA